MSSSAEDAMPLLRSWIAGKEPLMFSFAVESVVTVTVREPDFFASLSDNEETLVLEAEGLRFTFVLPSATSILPSPIPGSRPQEIAGVDIRFPKALLSLAKFRR